MPSPEQPRFDVLDDAQAEILRRLTPAERLAVGFGLWRSAREMLTFQLASLHPDWDAERVSREVARRLSHGENPHAPGWRLREDSESPASEGGTNP
jgi:hypothetical protein